MPADLVPLWIENSDRFHLIFYDYCNNQKLKTAAEKLRSQLTIFSNIYETQPDVQQNINQMHVSIYEAYRAGDIVTAGNLMKEHLEDSLIYALKSFQNLYSFR
jgi:DNA-binding GntR family transcriptional regulator